jgi:hypothetical protein
MQVSQDFAIGNEGQRLHVEVSPLNGRRIMKHQEDAGNGKNNEEETGNSSQAEGIRELQSMPFDLCRKNMKKEIVVDHHRPFQIGIRYPGSEDRAPNC